MQPPVPDVAGRDLRLLSVNADGAFAARGRTVYRLAHSGGWEPVLERPGSLVSRLGERVRLWRRFRRSDISAVCVAADGSTICIGRGEILRAPMGTAELSPIYRVMRGTRPLSIATADGVLYWGEYWGNPLRRRVTIHGSRDSGRSWYAAYVFPAGSIRHVHRVVYDEVRRRVWVLTGDKDAESKILWTDDHFASVHTATEGSQRSRAVTAVFVPGGMIWGTDDPDGKNYIRMLRDDGSIEDLAELEGPSFYCGRAGEFVLVSTAVEPSHVNVTGTATLMVAAISDLRNWKGLLHFKKDRWPMKLFQYGNITVPQGTGDGRYAWASGVSLAGGDGMVWRWKLADLRSFLAHA